MTGLTSIGEGAFYGCTNLEHIEISASVTSVGGGGIFNGCTSLTADEIDYSGSAFSVSTYSTNVYVVTTDAESSGTRLISVFGSGASNLTTFDVSAYTEIDGAFMGLTSLESVTGTDNIVYIGNSTFSGCTALTTFGSTSGEITVSDSVTEIGDNVFYGDTAITTISMPLNTVGSDIISGCTSLTSITFTSGSETNVTDDAFEGAGDGSTVVKVLNLSGTSIGTSVSTSPGWKGMSVYTSDYSTYGTTLVEVTEP
ncbi:MAG: leucine-rich repeat protein, partial [Methanomethylophilus sp.]